MSPEKVRARWTSEGRTAAFVTASMSAYGDTGAAGTATVPAEAAEAARAMRMVEYAERGMGGIIAEGCDDGNSLSVPLGPVVRPA